MYLFDSHEYLLGNTNIVFSNAKETLLAALKHKSGYFQSCISEYFLLCVIFSNKEYALPLHILPAMGLTSATFGCVGGSVRQTDFSQAERLTSFLNLQQEIPSPISYPSSLLPHDISTVNHAIAVEFETLICQNFEIRSCLASEKCTYINSHILAVFKTAGKKTTLHVWTPLSRDLALSNYSFLNLLPDTQRYIKLSFFRDSLTNYKSFQKFRIHCNFCDYWLFLHSFHCTSAPKCYLIWKLSTGTLLLSNEIIYLGFQVLMQGMQQPKVQTGSLLSIWEQ